MKSFTSKINEAAVCVTADVNPGNALQTTGVTNHYTPVQNIVTNVRNLFAARLSFVCAVAEDGVSVKLHSSKFVDKESINAILYQPLYRGSEASVAQYIMSQGLNKIKLVSVGMYYVVYFYADDLKAAGAGEGFEKNVKEYFQCDQQVELGVNETELDEIVKEEEEELKNATLEKVMELIDSKDKVKAAKQLELLVSQQIELPREYYFAGIKFKDGDEAIALRWRYSKKLPTGKTTENVRSIMHIFGKGDKGIWVQDFAEDSLVQLPEEMKKLIESILELLEAGKTDDPAIFTLTGEPQKREDDDKDDKDKDKDNSDDQDNDDDDDPDNEDDDSRGGNDDNK